MNTVKYGKDANYRLTIRTFPSMVEIVTRTINWQLENMRSENCGLRSPKKNELETPLSAEERARKDEENVNRSVRRARQSVRWLIQRMEADHMLTLTYRENMDSVQRLKKDFDHFRRLATAKYPKWKYVAIKEYQKRGSLHMHIAVKGHQDIKFLRKCWYRVLGCLGATGSDTLGSVNVRAPSRRWGGRGYEWRQDKLASYLTKYLHKGFDSSEHSSKRYWASKGLPKPIVQCFWMASRNMLEMILDSFDMAMLSGMQNMPDFYQSPDRTMLFLKGVKSSNSCVGQENDHISFEY